MVVIIHNHRVIRNKRFEKILSSLIFEDYKSYFKFLMEADYFKIVYKIREQLSHNWFKTDIQWKRE